MQEIYPANIKNNYIKQILEKLLPQQNLKNCFHKAAEAGDQFIGNEFSDKIVKPKPLINENSRNAEESYSIREKTRNTKQIKT